MNDIISIKTSNTDIEVVSTKSIELFKIQVFLSQVFDAYDFTTAHDCVDIVTLLKEYGNVYNGYLQVEVPIHLPDYLCDKSICYTCIELFDKSPSVIKKDGEKVASFN